MHGGEDPGATVPRHELATLAGDSKGRAEERLGGGTPGADRSPLAQRTVQQGARRAHERLALEVLAIAGLPAHQRHCGAGGAFAEHGLGGVAVLAF